MATRYCSFCGKREDEVANLVTGPSNVGICNECHDLMRSMMPEPPPLPSAEQRAEKEKQFDEWMAAHMPPPTNT